MRVRNLVPEVRCALRLSNVSCELSDADIEALLRESMEELGPRRTGCVIECTVAKAQHACEELTGIKPTRRRIRRCR